MNIFILEDDPYRHLVFKRELAEFDLTIREDTDTAVKCLLTEGPFDIIFFDHDLGGKQMIDSHDYETGYEVVKQVLLAESKTSEGVGKSFHPGAIFIIHSLNHSGARNIASILPYESEIIPFININWYYIRKNLRLFRKANEH